jgi:hypothetical protein
MQKKAHAKLTGGHSTREGAQRESDRANVPVIHADDLDKAIKDGIFKPENIKATIARAQGIDPWDGKKRLDAAPKSLRVPFTEDEIRERRIDLEKRLAQTPHLRDQVSAASDALKAAKAKLTSHVADSEGFSAITKQGWEYRDVECITVLEQRPGGHQLAVVYRTDTGEEVSKREATKDEIQDSIPGV